MSLLKKLAGLAVGAAVLGAAAYVLKNREHGEEYEHIVGPEDEVEPETESAEPADEDASAVAEPAPAAAPEKPAAPAETAQPEESAEPTQEPAAPKAADFDAPNVNPVELGHIEAPRTADGKFDPTQIVDPAVAGDWEEQGCKG